MKSDLHCSEDFRRLSEKNGSQIHDNTFQTEFADFWASFLPFEIIRWMCFAFLKGNSKVVWKEWGLKYTITLFRLNWKISELLSCLLELQGECEVCFALQWGLSKAVWKEWISNTLLYFSDWIARFLSFLLAFGITRWCGVHFTVQWGLSKAVWKEWISNTLVQFSDWIVRLLSFLLAFWN